MADAKGWTVVDESAWTPVDEPKPKAEDVAKYGDQIVPPGGVQHEPDTWIGGFAKSLKDQLLGATVGNPMLQGAAHPKEPGDFLGLLLPNGADFGVGARAAADSAAPTVTRSGAALEKTGAYLDPRAKYLAGGLALHGNIPSAAGVLAVPKAVQGAGRGLQKVGQLMTKGNSVDRFMPNVGADWTAPGAAGMEVTDLPRGVNIERYSPNVGGMAPVEEAAVAERVPYGAAEVPAPTATPGRASAKVAPGAIPADHLKELRKAGYSEELIAQMEARERALQGGAAPTAQRESILQGLSPTEMPAPRAPVAGTKSARFAEGTQGGDDLEALQQAIYGEDVPMQIPGHGGNGTGPALPESPLKAPRVRTGAERVGRGVGKPKEEIRAETGPILGEAPGEASPVLPQRVFEDIYDKMRGLPRDGAGRIDYVTAARDPKTKAQLELIRRTLERSGLLLALGAGAASGRPAGPQNNMQPD